MSTRVDSGEFRLDGLKWLLVILIVAGATFGNSYYSDAPLLYRVLALVGLGLVACFVAANTAKGHSFWTLLKSAQVELRKVVWPSRQETNQTTLLVLAVVAVMAIILWLLDTALGWLASLIIA